MDPLEHARPDTEGFLLLQRRSGRLHYQLFRPPTATPTSGSGSGTRSPLLMVMGAFALKEHFATTARHIADACGHEVCLYDHVGVGRSGPPRLEPQTAKGLAADALELADGLWGAAAPVHVYGASMGGMVAQELAVLLIPRRRLLSLSLAITCRGMQPAWGLLAPMLSPRVILRFLQAWFGLRTSRPVLVRRLMRLLLTRELLAARHPATGETYEEVYARVWEARFDELWTLGDHRVGACHAHVVLHQHTSDAALAAIRGCGAPLLMQVATEDRLIPAAMQFELAAALQARTVTFPTGHLGLLPWRERFHGMLHEQLAMGEAIKHVNNRAAADSSAAAAAAAAAGSSIGARAAAAGLVAAAATAALAVLTAPCAAVLAAPWLLLSAVRRHRHVGVAAGAPPACAAASSADDDVQPTAEPAPLAVGADDGADAAAVADAADVAAVSDLLVELPEPADEEAAGAVTSPGSSKGTITSGSSSPPLSPAAAAAAAATAAMHAALAVGAAVFGAAGSRRRTKKLKCPTAVIA